ncbi:MAG: glutathione transferase GstA [Sphingosinicella sp.]|nr:glutathione transferase GstA [Sphingosinicella sp.]
MKLYYLPGACSLASHILLREAGADFTLVQVERGTGRTTDGGDYTAINPLGYVPALGETEHGILLENGAILPFLAQKFGFVGIGGFHSMLQEIGFLSTELHKAYSPFFKNPNIAGRDREGAESQLHSRLGRYEQAYAGTDFNAAKAYAFVITNWSAHVGVSLEKYPRINAMRDALSARRSVRAAMAAEGLS